MAKYLPHYGWRPLVVSRLWTPQDGAYDPDFVAGLPQEALVAAIPDDTDEGQTRFLRRMRTRARLLLYGTRYPPRWTRGVMRLLPELFAQKKIDAVWASFWPHSVFHIADRALREYGVPWVADFRDVLGQFGRRELRIRLLHARTLPWERRLVRSAAAVTTVSEGLAQMLRARLAREVLVIPNGFDPDDLTDAQDVTIRRFNIVFTGTLARDRDFRLMLEALSRLLEAGRVSEDDLSVECYGETEGRFRDSMSNGYKSPQVLTFHGPVPAKCCAHVCRDSAVLFLPGFPGRKGVMTGKVFEYLAAQRPILCAPADGDCIDALLRETGAGVSCSTVDETARQLLQWYREWKATGTIKYHGNRDAIMKYSRERQAGQLAELLDRVVA